MLLWGVLVSRYTKYGDDWAIYPVFAIFAIIILLHLSLIYFEKGKLGMIIYGILHSAVAFYFLLYCLTVISKDSL
jgi:hypothetical protein